ncbi:hypothetical protein RHMOL_Rhmol07G0195000 [Rhododendron molle]|nr:hypothetical protein RHMOL_Rhmol07G0195000 [Rhododendron molle]
MTTSTWNLEEAKRPKGRKGITMGTPMLLTIVLMLRMTLLTMPTPEMEVMVGMELVTRHSRFSTTLKTTRWRITWKE